MANALNDTKINIQKKIIDEYKQIRKSLNVYGS